MGRVWSSRGAQQGVARCTHAGRWLESNLFVTLPRTTLMIESLQPSTNCYKLSDLTMPLPPLHSVYNGSMIQTPRRSLCAAAMRTKAKQPSP